MTYFSASKVSNFQSCVSKVRLCKWALRIFFFSEAEYELEKTEKVLQETLNERAVETKKFQEQASQLLYLKFFYAYCSNDVLYMT